MERGMMGNGFLRALLRQGVAGLLLACLMCTPVLAAMIDTIDVARVGDQAEITVRFATEIQYVRHAPESSGRYLRIFFRVTKPGFSESDLMQEVRRSPKSDLIPAFTLTYPELVNGLLVSFARPTPYIVRPGDDSRSIVIMLPLPEDRKRQGQAPAALSLLKAESLRSPPAVSPLPAEPVAAPAVQSPEAEKPEAAAPMTAEKVDELAHAFLLDGREAFVQGDYGRTINRLNRILSLPTNAYTREAQALIGEAREKNGEIAKARAEYELFLKLFPNAAESASVRSRLDALPAADSVRRTPVRAVARDDRPAEWTVTGSLSSYYFTGQSKQDGSAMKRDQDSLVSSASLNARLRDGASDTRLVFRDTDSRNFMQSSRDYNRIYSAYVERTDRDIGYFVRLGRQNPNGAGVLERFDGINASYNLSPDWKLGAVYGEAVEFGSPFHKTFYGANIELLPQVARPGVSLYAIEQNLDGYLNRRAVGSEMRYFDGQLTGYGMLDYDLLYKGLNIGMAQANYLDSAGNNYFISYDYRKTPSYSLTNGLGTSGYTTVDEMVGAMGVSRARQLASDATSLSKMFAAGVTLPFGERWQFGFDYRMSEISGTSALIPLSQMCKELQDSANPTDPLCVDGPRGTLRVSEMGICVADSYDMITKTCQASTEASGRTHMYSAQAVGTNLFVPNGVGVAYLGYVAGPTYSGHNLGLSYVYPFAESWRLEGNARYYSQKSDGGMNLNQFSPSLKLVQQWGNLALEGELGYSESETTGPSPSKYRREYLYLGVRWDYR